jgi:hypothetical protein
LRGSRIRGLAVAPSTALKPGKVAPGLIDTLPVSGTPIMATDPSEHPLGRYPTISAASLSMG